MEVITAGKLIVDKWLECGIIKEIDGKLIDRDGDEIRRREDETRVKKDK